MTPSEKRRLYQLEYSRRYRAAHPKETRATVDRYQTANSVKVKARRAKHRAANKERIYAKTAEWRERNIAQAHAAVRNWQRANKDRVNAHIATRRAAEIQRTPEWADKQAIASVYAQAESLSQSGTRYHVDHVIPLRGRKVSGLHVPENLQVLPWYKNLSKNNKFEVA